MPRAKETIRVQVNEQTEGETRHFIITITAPVQEFLLTDVLRQRGAISSPEAALKQVVRECLQNYLDGTEELVAGLAAGQWKGGNGAKPKAKSGTEGRGDETSKETGEPGWKGRPEGEINALKWDGAEARQAAPEQAAMGPE